MCTRSIRLSMDKSLNKQSHTILIKSENNDRSQRRKRQTEKMSKGNKSKISYLWKTGNVRFCFRPLFFI
jgi:hypothetical protein